MRKLIWAAIFSIAVALAFFSFAPGLIEASMNKVDGKPLSAISDEAKALHKTLTIVDLHSDSLMWDRDINDRADRGHVDVPRLQAGNVALQVFSSVTKTPKGQNYDGNGADTDNITLLTVAQLQPVRTWSSLVERSLYHAAKLGRAVKANDDLSLINSPEEAAGLEARRTIKGNTQVSAMLSIEGLQNLEGKAANLDRLYDCRFPHGRVDPFLRQ